MIDEKKMSKEGAKAFLEELARANVGNISGKKKKSTPRKNNKKKK